MHVRRFPTNFLWGASSAAHQVEGNNVNSDWWAWEQSHLAEQSGLACDHYHRYETDFALAQKLGHNAHRLSIEWSRIVPREGVVDKKQIAHYRAVLLSLKKKHMATFVTLHHFTNPLWFAKKGGFARRSNITYFTEYARVCAEAFGDLVDFWVTINEPTTYILKSYLLGAWPPGKRNPLLVARVYRTLTLAHAAAYRTIKEHIPTASVGAAHQLVHFYSEGGLVNNLLTAFFSWFANDYFYRHTGDTHDFYGINYYFSNPVSWRYLFVPITSDDYEKIIRDHGKPWGWTMNPAGISPCLHQLSRYPRRPIYILEHGISDPSDRRRASYLRRTLAVLHTAIAAGVPVQGYLHWTLTDNYEWNLGYRSKFGLVAVDPRTKRRTPKPSAYAYRRIIVRNGI